MGASPTYVPVIRTGVDVTFGDLAATGTLTVAGATTLSGPLTGTSGDFSSTLEVDGVSTFNGAINCGTVNPSLVSIVAAGDALRVFTAGDAQPRLKADQSGVVAWGPGGAVATDTTLSRSGINALNTPGFFAMGSGQSGGNFSVFGTALILGSAGTGLQIKEGANATSGIATLVAGTVTVNTNKVTATSRIQLTSQVDGGTPGFQRVSARVAGTSFTITSSNAADTSQVAWTLIEPAP